MKKSLILVGAACAAVLTLTGCFYVNTNDAAVKAQVQVKKDVTADIQTGQKKVSGKANINCLFGFIIWGTNEFADDAFVCSTNAPFQLFACPATLVKKGATYQACKAAKADYILGAKYRLDTRNYFVFKQYECKVTGYPAYLKGIK